MNMTLNDSAIIALSFCVIVFPTFVIIPSAFAIYKRIAEFWFAAFHITAFAIAALSLIVAVVYSAIALFNGHSRLDYSLAALLILFTIAISYFLYKLHQWLWELALLDVVSEAEAKES